MDTKIAGAILLSSAGLIAVLGTVGEALAHDSSADWVIVSSVLVLGISGLYFLFNRIAK